MTFRDSLEDLRNHVGNRNGMLLSVAIRGLGEGLTPDAVAEAFAATDTGDPPLTAQEVARAISRAKAYLVGEPGTTAAVFRSKMRRAEKEREATGPDERGFVPRMIRAGVRHANPMKRLLELSAAGLTPELRRCPHSIEARRAQAVSFVRALYDDESGYVFATSNVRFQRTRERIFRASELVDRLQELSPFQNCVSHFSPLEFFQGCNPEEGFFVCPTHISTNYYTGDSVKINGKESFANKRTLVRRCNTLVEFDLLPIDDQAAFWVGVIESRALDVRTIVYTGNKSLHGVVRVKDEQDGDDLFGDTSTTAKEQQWDRSVAALWRLCCSNDDQRFRCDAACRDATRMTRFPGGLRDYYNQQLMVYCKGA